MWVSMIGSFVSGAATAATLAGADRKARRVTEVL
jgi:hypothetical protein